jgi:hypothetical protein
MQDLCSSIFYPSSNNHSAMEKMGGDNMTEVVVSRTMFIAGLIMAILASSSISTIASMQLAVGPQGEKGDQGETGTRGVQGIQGDIGPQGKEGPIGPEGPEGYSPWENGSISISALAFKPENPDWVQSSNLTYLMSYGGSHWAPVQLPHKATILNITAYLYDQMVNEQMIMELWGYNLSENSSMGVMAHIETSWEGNSTEIQVLHNDTILYSRIDNANCIYALRVLGTAASKILYFRAAVIEYKYLG